MGYNGKLAERLKASDCKSDSRMRYGGSNPSLTTRRVDRMEMLWFAKPLFVGSIPTHASKKDLTFNN